MSSLAGRLAALASKLAPDDHQRVRDLAAGKDIAQIAVDLLHALDPDAEAALRRAADDTAREAIAAELRAEAAKVFDEPKLRRLLIAI